MKHLLSFLAGVIAGIIGYTLWQHWQVWGKPVLPSERLFNDVTLPTRPASPMEGLAYFIGGLSRSLEDTQPIPSATHPLTEGKAEGVKMPWRELGYNCGEPWGNPTVTGVNNLHSSCDDPQPVKVDTTYDMTADEVEDFTDGMYEVGHIYFDENGSIYVGERRRNNGMA